MTADNGAYGYVKISRKMYLPESDGGDVFWNEKRVFSRYEAWEYMIQAAAFRAHDCSIPKGPVVRLGRGETRPLSVRYLMRAWGWGSKKRVTGYLQLLHELGRIRTAQRTASGDTYHIVNYDFWQGTGDSNGDTGGDSPGDTPGYKREERKERKERKASRARRLSDEWEPDEDHERLAKELGVSLKAELPKFRDYWKGNGKAKTDWNATFRNWLRRAAEFQPGSGPQPFKKSTGYRHPDHPKSGPIYDFPVAS